MSLKNIHAGPLLLIPITLEITASLLNHEKNEIEKLGLQPDVGWPTTDTMDILPSLYENLKQNGLPSGFETWMIVKKESKKIIGDIGFHGKPNDLGEAEVGYGLVESEQGKGFGYQALKVIVDWALSQDSVKILNAKCLLNNKASARILEKAGMRQVKRKKGYVYWVLIKSDTLLHNREYLNI